MWLTQGCDAQSWLLEVEKENSSHIRRLSRLVRTAQRNRYMCIYLDTLGYMWIYIKIFIMKCFFTWLWNVRSPVIGCLEAGGPGKTVV